MLGENNMFLAVKLMCLCFYGLFVGWVAKLLHPGPVGFLWTAITGIAGTYIGGLINYLLGWGSFLSTSGIIMSVLGGVIFLAIYRWINLRKQGRSFWSGRSLL